MRGSIFSGQAKLLISILPQAGKEEVFALKGGTAINYFFRELPRLSVDIDLAYLPVKPREESLQGISESVQRIMDGVLYAIPGIRIIPKKEDETGLIKGFTAILKNEAVKVEPNLVLRGSVFPAESRPLCKSAVDLFGVQVIGRTLSFADLYGGKLCAALDRQHPRDLFDVKLLMENEGITEAVRKAFLVYLVSHPRPMAELLEPNPKDIENVFKTEFQGMTRVPVTLHELLEVMSLIPKKLRSSLTESEKKFLISFKQGEPDYDLLGLDGVSRLPAVQWKLQNIKIMNPKKHVAAVEKLKRCLQ